MFVFTLCFVLGIASVGAYSQSQVSTFTPDYYFKINSIKELQKKVNKKKQLTKNESRKILEATEPSVLMEYSNYVDKKATDIVENSEPDIVYSNDDGGTTEIYKENIDAMSSFELVLEDHPERNLKEKVVSSVIESITDKVSAASNGEEKWKAAKGKTKNETGNHYFTAKYKRNIGPGYVKMCTENHYNVTKDCKIKERYGTSWADTFASVTGDLYGTPSHTIEDQWANKEGEDAHIKTRFTVKYVVDTGVAKVTTYSTFYERTKIKLLKKDKKNKRVKVKHTWSKVG